MRMLRNWIAGKPTTTLPCVAVSVVCLVLSLGGWANALLPFDWGVFAVVLCGLPILAGAGSALVLDHDVKAGMLVSIALLAACLSQQWFAAGEVGVIMQLGELLERFTANRARRGIQALVDLVPRTARVKAPQGGEETVPVEQVRAGDVLVVLAGETVPVDGLVQEGTACIDQSAMTGESVPLDKQAGDEVMSGTISLSGAFEMRAARASEDSSLQRMVRLAERADAAKAPVVRQADAWAGWLVGCALACAVLIGLFTHDALRAVTVLVVFCPCAFVLATPTAVAASIANLAKHGVLVRSGEALERLAKTRRLVFDKTGTLTQGRPRVEDVESFGGTLSPEEVLWLAASVEQRSEHPLGKAIARSAPPDARPLELPEKVLPLVGRGIEAVLGGKSVIVASPGEFERRSIPLELAQGFIGCGQARGAALALVALDGALVGAIALADAPRPRAASALASLEARGIETILLTGDSVAAAQRIAEKLGIDQVRSEMLPEEKMDFVKALGEAGTKACMVGDGVNDVLAMRAAYAGVAMGGIGSDAAVESADAVLVSDDIDRLPFLMAMSQACLAKIRSNIIASLIINAAAIALSALAILDPLTGALWHNCGSVFVVLNAARLMARRSGEPGGGRLGRMLVLSRRRARRDRPASPQG